MTDKCNLLDAKPAYGLLRLHETHNRSYNHYYMTIANVWMKKVKILIRVDRLESRKSLIQVVWIII